MTNDSGALKTQSVEAGFEKAYWEQVWETIKLPQTRDPKRFHEIHARFKRHLPTGQASLMEIGCAPGSWLSYFAREFGYRVAGIEYAEAAYEKTLQNMKLLSIPADIHLADFFEFSGQQFDIIFSYGFVEHFPTLTPILERLVSFANPGGYIVTCIPSLEGFNWWISRQFRPEVAAGHYPITKQALRVAHEKQGLETLWVGRYGSGHIRPPFDNTRLSARTPGAARLLNTPFKLWNKSVSVLTRSLKIYPQSNVLFTGTLYIGRRPAP